MALIGAGPASLTVARDLLPLGYDVTVFDGDNKLGGMIRTQIPRFRLPESVIDEEVGYVARLGLDVRSGKRVDSLKSLLGQGFDAVFIGSGAPRGRDLDLPGRTEAAASIHIGIDWLSSVSFGHVTNIGKRVLVLGGGNTAMDCCRSSKRLGGEDVRVVVRSGFDEMKASPWKRKTRSTKVFRSIIGWCRKASSTRTENLSRWCSRKSRPSSVPTASAAPSRPANPTCAWTATKF